jgi:hypothetical protein
LPVAAAAAVVVAWCCCWWSLVPLVLPVAAAVCVLGAVVAGRWWWWWCCWGSPLRLLSCVVVGRRCQLLLAHGVVADARCRCWCCLLRLVLLVSLMLGCVRVCAVCAPGVRACVCVRVACVAWSVLGPRSRVCRAASSVVGRVSTRTRTRTPRSEHKTLTHTHTNTRRSRRLCLSRVGASHPMGGRCRR